MKFSSSCRESLQLLDFCYREDNMQTLKLLTAQLPHWGHQNCLSLAVMANHKPFLAHPCCQRLLAELWHGSLRVRSPHLPAGCTGVGLQGTMRFGRYTGFRTC
ncbi:hypothetical protein ANCCAN_28341 [Ancylostoma caninum]|uniref:TRPM-like domain-containing protein n=1 Tax=Ancylostoma caninum TaxID=29170 RepID=A0A368F1J4_ANCCA|nr:hypothetical protein ANCCAN_28341 [Ancylostoma caninum]